MFEALRILSLVAVLLLRSTQSAYSTYDDRLMDHPRHSKYVGCYYWNKSIYRGQDGILNIGEPMKPVHKYCTHLIYAFAEITAEPYDIKASDDFADSTLNNGQNGYKEITKLRLIYPHLKVSLSIGGPDQFSAQRFSAMAKTKDYRDRFVNSVTNFLRNHNFQGLDVWWEYPPNKYGAIYDKENMIILLKELRGAFREHKLLLTATIAPNNLDIPDPIESYYEIRKVSEIVDHLHVKTYDYHITDKHVINPNAGIDQISATLDLLLDKHGVHAKKVIIGLPFYGRGYYLKYPLRSPTEDRLGKESRQETWAGEYNYNESGVFIYSEVCKYLKHNARTEERERDRERWTERWDNLSYTPYAISGDRVLVYDNPKSLQAKVQLAVDRGLGGVFVWRTDYDDFRGQCNPRYPRIDQPRNNHREHDRDYDRDDPKFPLLKAITEALERSEGIARASSLGILTLTFALAASLHLL